MKSTNNHLNQEPLWNEAEYCAFVGIKPSTAQRQRYVGEGPSFVKVGRLVKYRPEDVRAWLDSQTQQNGED